MMNEEFILHEINFFYATASVILWACEDNVIGLESQDFEAVCVEGFVHAST